MTKKPILLIIAGPTAVGKTDIAIKLAKHYNTEIISTDSRQIYREMSIGTAKPDKIELETTKHHFINQLSIHEPFTAADFSKECLSLLKQKFSSGSKLIVMSGGTGLYIDSVINGFDKIPDIPASVSDKYLELYKKAGLAKLQDQLLSMDEEYHDEVDLNNPRRLIRALSVIEHTGKKFSNFRTNTKQIHDFEIVYIVLHLERQILYERINARVDSMLKMGLFAEASALYPHRHLRSLQTVGYQEIFENLDGNCSLETAVDKIKQHTRNYAKRQITWFKKAKNTHVILSDSSAFQEITKIVANVDMV